MNFGNANNLTLLFDTKPYFLADVMTIVYSLNQSAHLVSKEKLCQVLIFGFHRLVYYARNYILEKLKRINFFERK